MNICHDKRFRSSLHDIHAHGVQIPPLVDDCSVAPIVWRAPFTASLLSGTRRDATVTFFGQTDVSQPVACSSSTASLAGASVAL